MRLVWCCFYFTSDLFLVILSYCVYSLKILIVPDFPSMRILIPDFRVLVKFGILTTAGIPISRATIAEWDSRLPRSTSKPEIAG